MSQLVTIKTQSGLTETIHVGDTATLALKIARVDGVDSDAILNEELIQRGFTADENGDLVAEREGCTVRVKPGGAVEVSTATEKEISVIGEGVGRTDTDYGLEGEQRAQADAKIRADADARTKADAERDKEQAALTAKLRENLEKIRGELKEVKDAANLKTLERLAASKGTVTRRVTNSNGDVSITVVPA